MKDRNNDEDELYVAEESVKWAFCGHFPILH